MTAAVIFVAVVLIVTGVAMWLLFSALNGTLGGNITVAGMVDSPLEFSRISIDGLDVDLTSEEHKVNTGFRFDSERGDNVGRLMWNGTDCEKLSVDVDVVIEHSRYLQQFEYVLDLPQGVIDAAERGYLDIDAYYDREEGKPKRIEIPISTGTSFPERDAWRVRFTLTLGWGEVFGGINPSRYYDEAGAGIPYDEVRDTLNDFYDMVMSGTVFSNPTFTLTLIASPKV